MRWAGAGLATARPLAAQCRGHLCTCYAVLHCQTTTLLPLLFTPPHPTPPRIHSLCPVGCILAELLQRKPLFPGKDYIDQLKLIIRTLVRGRQRERRWGAEVRERCSALLGRTRAEAGGGGASPGCNFHSAPTGHTFG